ncbi:hypothetical protein [Bacillus paralicheniformis]|uniref:hypothetical protein n=1 Tax=Bacillus paralicheniformis TaxID=1648923 RepID=UPI001FD6CB77|nr:hypothetical protein [Bacillus paralicheniformis]MCJ8223662.1 hypothetical protein [Bacillus paralicheniformis]
MNKRQKKKRENKYLSVIADEALFMMTESERRKVLNVIKKTNPINRNHRLGISHTQSLSDFVCGDDSLNVLKSNNILNKRKV